MASPGNYNKLSTRSHERSRAHKRTQPQRGADKLGSGTHKHKHTHIEPSQFPDPVGERPHGHTHTPRRTLIIHNWSCKSKDRVRSCCSDGVFVFGEIYWPRPKLTPYQHSPTQPISPECPAVCQQFHFNVFKMLRRNGLRRGRRVFSLNFAITHLCGSPGSVLG